jgi:hypothetical protein
MRRFLVLIGASLVGGAVFGFLPTSVLVAITPAISAIGAAAIIVAAGIAIVALWRFNP